MINFGPYSGKNCPNVRFQPTVLDRILEGMALLVVLVTWIGIYRLYVQKGGSLSPDVWIMGGFSVFCFLLMGIAGYLPIRFFKFPVRVTGRNAAVQYLLAMRFTRVMNIIFALMFLDAAFRECFVLGDILFFVPIALLGLAFAGYYVLAFKYR